MHKNLEIEVDPNGEVRMYLTHEGSSRRRQGNSEASRQLVKFLQSKFPLPDPLSDKEFFDEAIDILNE